MGKVTGFLEFKRDKQPYRPVAERLHDWQAGHAPLARSTKLEKQAARCMDCGIPFCHQGCPLGNLIPDWNDLVYREHWREAIDRLHATNNFPEFTGTLCPAPCEGSCVLGINDDPVTIKADRARDHRSRLRRGLGRARAAGGAHRQEGRGRRLRPRRARRRPAAQPRRPLGDRASSAPTGSAGCSATASPSSRWRSASLDRRLDQMEAEGVRFVTGRHVGRRTSIRRAICASEFDALAPGGGRVPRRATCPSPAASSTASTSRWST